MSTWSQRMLGAQPADEWRTPNPRSTWDSPEMGSSSQGSRSLRTELREGQVRLGRLVAPPGLLGPHALLLWARNLAAQCGRLRVGQPVYRGLPPSQRQVRAGAWSGEAKEGRPQGQCHTGERAACMPPPPCFLLLPGPHRTYLFLVRTCVCGVPSPALWSGSGLGSSALSGLGDILEGQGQAPGLCRGTRPVAVVSDPHPWPLASGLCWIRAGGLQP